METKLSVKIDPRGAEQGASTVDRILKGMGSSFVNTSAKVFVLQQALDRAWQAAKKGAEFEETMSRLNRQMSTFHSTGQRMINGLDAITRGTLSMERAATMASRALAVGLNPDQIRTFTQAADVLDDVMGTDLPTAFDNIVQAAITGRSTILSNIGVTVDLEEEVRKLAVSTGRTTDQITRQEKIMLAANAITDQTARSLHRLSDGALSDADKLGQLAARFDNLITIMNLEFKAAVIESIDWLAKLGTALERFKPSNMAAPYIRATGLDAGQSGNPIWEQVMGRAIVQDALGNLARQRDSFTNSVGSAPIPELPTSLRGSQLDAERERQDRGIQGDLERTKTGLDAAARLVEMDAQRQLVTQEDLSREKGMLRLQEVASTGETLAKLKQMEEQFHARRVAIGFESTEERITAEETYRSKVFEINQALKSNANDFAEASTLNIAEQGLAREQAEQRRGQGLTDSFRSAFEIQESLRRQDLEDAQTYYQGEFDMAVARFAGDEEIARKERELLREQLAFKLRLTQEEVDRILFLRKAGDFEGVRQITGRADPSLNPRAVEGIVESATSKDILAAERANGDFFAGWSRGLQKYAQDRDSAFGMSQDMARRTAQAMEQGFQTFFFDGMEGKFNSFKDVLSSVLDVTKQIISQIAAQMLTVGIIKPGAEALSGWFSGLGKQGDPLSMPAFESKSFASGGMDDFGAGTPAMLHGREAIVPLPDGRSIPVMMRMPAATMPPVNVNVTVINKTEAQVSVQRSPGSGGKEEVMVMIEQAVDRNLASGRHDKILQSRFGMTPGRG